jgi:hypothetical protein
LEDEPLVTTLFQSPDVEASRRLLGGYELALAERQR